MISYKKCAEDNFLNFSGSLNLSSAPFHQGKIQKTSIFCMKKKYRKFIRLIFFLFLFSVIIRSALSDCTANNTPQLNLPENFNLYEGKRFYYEIDVNYSFGHDLLFSYNPVKSSFENFEIKNTTGIIDFIPQKNDAGLQRIIIFVINEKECYDTQLLKFKIFDSPGIIYHYPEEEYVIIKEGEKERFYVNASTEILEDNKYYYRWLLNQNIRSIENEFIYSPGFSDSGTYNLTVIVTDKNRLETSHTWKIRVENVNRNPVHLRDTGDIYVSANSNFELFNLNDYFTDYDNDTLGFDYWFIKNRTKTKESENFDVNISDSGDVSVKSLTNSTITEKLEFRAGDSSGEYASGTTFNISSVSKQSAEDFFSTGNCTPDINCGDWSECFSTGLRIRKCIDNNNCTKQDKELIETEKCDYSADCFDGIRNQKEEGIDCGGPCLPCPSCSDGLKNQNEEKTDCGGPCETCPDCFDFIKNQDETDVDCGGSCRPCRTGEACIKDNDCISLNCKEKKCMNAICSDSIKNQGEEDIDCGGPCPACANCTDSIKNQEEEGIDCGGPCESCATCSDNIKNQGEFLEDCGGPCKNCFAVFFEKGFEKIPLPVIFVFTIIIIVVILGKFYVENDVDLLLTLSRFTKFIIKIPDQKLEKATDETIEKLRTLKQEFHGYKTDEELAEKYNEIINNYFQDILDIEDVFTIGVLEKTLKKKIKNIFARRLLFLVYENSSVSLEGNFFFKLELEHNIQEIQNLLRKIKQAL
ncbi:hypothetical protein GF327_03620 [Candidatus Woesearchaeota archaeon]|nr:hypothetical protein [Candidatus Woesearchaeota archaeon]